MKTFAHSDEQVTPEIPTSRIAAIGKLKWPLAFGEMAGSPPVHERRRNVIVAGSRCDIPVVDGAHIHRETSLGDPVIVEESQTLHFVPLGGAHRALSFEDLAASNCRSAVE